MTKKKKHNNLTDQEFQEMMGLSYGMGQQRMEPLIASLLDLVEGWEENEDMVALVNRIGLQAERNALIVDALFDKYEVFIERLIGAADGNGTPPEALN